MHLLTGLTWFIWKKWKSKEAKPVNVQYMRHIEAELKRHRKQRVPFLCLPSCTELLAICTTLWQASIANAADAGTLFVFLQATVSQQLQMCYF